MKVSNNKQLDAEVIFEHDRICCVCNKAINKNIQIHHIDENHDNNSKENLSVLCVDCHEETLIKGGFVRRLTPELVELYRDKWVAKVKRKRDKETQSESFKLYKELPNQDNEFTRQFEIQKITPIGVTFYFKDHYYETAYFPSIIVTSNELNETNGDRYRSILKAYLLCTLGYIAPSKYLDTNTLRISDSGRAVVINGNQQIWVPDWYISRHKDIFPLHILGQYIPKTNEIEYLIFPFLHDKYQDYSFLKPSFDIICRELVGKFLTL